MSAPPPLAVLPDRLHPCPTGTLLATRDHGFKLVPAGCHRWACDSCGRKNARKLASRIMRTKARRLITLTLPYQPGADPAEQLDRMNAAWLLLWKRIKRRQGDKAVGYAKIVELTRKGTPHLHIAADCGYLPQRWLSVQWHELSGAAVVDVRRVTTEAGLARYLSKYLTKAVSAVSSRRKYSASRGFLPPYQKTPRPEDLDIVGWRYSNGPLEAIEAGLAAAGYEQCGPWWMSPPDG